MPIEYYSPISGGAVSTVIMQQVRQLVACGHDVTVLTIVNGDPTYHDGRVVAIRAGTHDSLSLAQRALSKWHGKAKGWDYPYYEHYLRSFATALRSMSPRPEVIVIHNDLVSARYVKLAIRGVKVVVYLHNEQRTRQRRVVDAIRQVDLFVCVSEYIRTWAQQEYRIPDARITSILNGVDLDRFQPRPDHLLSRMPVKVLFIGRINRDKGPDLVVDACAALMAEGFPITLTVAGSVWWYNHEKAPHDPFFQMLTAKMNAVGVDYVGHVTRERVPTLIRDHDIACLPSRWNDPCPLVPLEAMASGCAVVSSSRGGIPEACGDGALLINPDDEGSVASTLRSLVADPESLAALKQRGRERAAALGWSRNAAEFEAALLRLRSDSSEPKDRARCGPAPP